MKYNPYDKNKKSICPICGNTVYVDSVGNGDKCPNCSWIKSSINEEFPDRVMCPNLIPLNKAKKLYKEGKPFIPDFDDFISGFCFYGEMEFTYQGKRYGVTLGENETVDFFVVNTKIYRTFKNYEDFKNNAKIDDEPVKDIWKEVQNANWLQ